MCHKKEFKKEDKLLKLVGGGSVINGATPSSFCKPYAILKLIAQTILIFQDQTPACHGDGDWQGAEDRAACGGGKVRGKSAC